MNKLVLILLIGMLLVSSVMAEIYEGSTSVSFFLVNGSSDTNIGLTLIWIAVGFILFLTILYLLFRKKKKISRKKKL
jgi:hypothetical protein